MIKNKNFKYSVKILTLRIYFTKDIGIVNCIIVYVYYYGNIDIGRGHTSVNL